MEGFTVKICHREAGCTSFLFSRITSAVGRRWTAARQRPVITEISQIFHVCSLFLPVQRRYREQQTRQEGRK